MMRHQHLLRLNPARRRLAAWALLVLFVCVALPTPGRAHEANKNAVAQLAVKNAAGENIGSGTGFVVEPEGVLVTNYHVLVDAAAVLAEFPDGRRAAVTGILKVDRVRDFALLQLAEGFYSTLEIGDSASLKDFDFTTALGFPVDRQAGDDGPVMQTYGFVLGIHPQAYPGFSYIYTSTPFGPGFSGGPLLDRNNKVVGLATLAGRSINLALPIDEVKPLVKAGPGRPFAKLLGEDKNSPEAMYYRGNFLLYAMGDLEGAKKVFEDLLKREPGFALAHYDLAVVQRDSGDIEQAIASYERALAINPNFPEALSNLGGFYFRTGEAEKARATFERALGVYPNFVQALSNLGAVLNKVDRAGEAEPLLKKALHLDPEFAVAHYNLGNAYFALGRLGEAEAAYNQAVALGVDFLGMHWKLYEIHRQKNDDREAVKQLQTILEMDPENGEAKKELEQLAPALKN